MKFDPQIHRRRSFRLKDFDYSRAGAYFVTLVTRNRITMFGEIVEGVMRMNQLGQITQNVWEQIQDFFPIQHDEWVIMPNHLQAILWIHESHIGEASEIIKTYIPKILAEDASLQRKAFGTKKGSLGAIIQNFKSISTRKIHQWTHDQCMGEAFTTIEFQTPSRFPVNASPQHIWQRNYYEHVVRNQVELDRIRLYIIDNPRKWAEDRENRSV